MKYWVFIDDQWTEVDEDRWRDEFNAGRPWMMAPREPVGRPTPRDVSGWEEIGYTTDVPAAFRRDA